MNPALPSIQVESLSKEYFIGARQRQFDRLSDQLAAALAAPLRRATRLLRGQISSAAELDERIWALQEVSFQVHPGEVVGVIGANGAGKSTLLKILSRITEPTIGYADIYGRVGSLLEVGTGFHQELTGRENVFLNGAILGMGRHEIAGKFDDIVAFSGIEKFIDTPVKHYSSGMYVRLAFAVAAHLQSDVLLVDEVLAVGDLEFQKKCLGKMDDVANDGRTVLFVSHNMGLVLALCQRGLLLQQGRLAADGPIDGVVDAYLKSLELNQAIDLAERTDRRGRGQVRLVGVDILNGSGSASALKTGDRVQICFQLDRLMRGLVCNFVIFDFLGRPVANFKSAASGPADVHDPEMGNQFVVELDPLLLMPGSYRLDVALRGAGQLQDFIEAAAILDIADGTLEGRPVRTRQSSIHVAMPHRWRYPVRPGD